MFDNLSDPTSNKDQFENFSESIPKKILDLMVSIGIGCTCLNFMFSPKRQEIPSKQLQAANEEDQLSEEYEEYQKNENAKLLI